MQQSKLPTGFLCECGGATQCMDSRPNKNGSVRRRRKCLTCGTRFTTWEIDLRRYHEMLKQLRVLSSEAGKIIRSVGPERAA